MLERSIEADHGHLILAEGTRNAGRLREAMLEAARAVLLERRHDDDLALQVLELQRFFGVEPFGGLKLGRLLGIEHQNSSWLGARSARGVVTA
jgi:hypothetical protein